MIENTEIGVNFGLESNHITQTDVLKRRKLSLCTEQNSCDIFSPVGVEG